MPAPQARGFGRQFVVLFLAGFLGIAALYPIAMAQLAGLQARGVDLGPLPLPVVALLSLMQSAVLLAVAVVVGIFLAPRLGFRSHLQEWARDGHTDWSQMRYAWRPALIVGAVGAALLLVLDLAFQPLLGSAWREVAQRAAPNRLLLSAVLYGGITEELLMRWGLLPLFAWLGLRITRQTGDCPSPGVVWIAIALTALIFGLGHLPALAAMITPTPTPWLVLRTVLLNFIPGVAFGWLFWRYSLEAAMLAHASIHVFGAVIQLVLPK